MYGVVDEGEVVLYQSEPWISSLNIFPAGGDGIHAYGAHTASACGSMVIKGISPILLALQATYYLIRFAFTQNFTECPGTASICFMRLLKDSF